MSYGIVKFCKEKLKFAKIIPLITIMFLFLILFWLITHNNFVLFTQKVISLQNTGDFINKNLPKDAGIMVQPGNSVELNYLTKNRVLGLYPKPDKLLETIKYFNVSYVVFSRHFTYDVYHISKDSIEYIKNNPDKFKFVAKIKEDYSDFFVEGDTARTDEIYIYEVV